MLSLNKFKLLRPRERGIRSKERVKGVLILTIALLFAGCASRSSVSSASLEKIEHKWQEGESQNRLLVYLTGRRDRAEDFEKRGMLAALRERGLAIDVVAVHAPLRLYRDRSIARRLRQEIVIPAKSKNYNEIWVVGNSLGGLGALLTEKAYPHSWDKIFLLSPFLGKDRSLFQDFDSAGGVDNWHPTQSGPTEFTFSSLWAWLKDFKQLAPSRPETYLGYGTSDSLARSNSYLAALLPPERVIKVAGGHHWKVWLDIWDELLNTQI